MTKKTVKLILVDPELAKNPEVSKWLQETEESLNKYLETPEGKEIMDEALRKIMSKIIQDGIGFSFKH